MEIFYKEKSLLIEKMIIPKNILIVRNDSIGDVVLSLPLAGLIKNQFPDCKVTFLLRNYTKDIANDHPNIDDIIILKEDNGKIPVWKNVNQLKKCLFDASIIVYPTFITALIIFLARVKFRVGSGYRWYSFLFNKKVFEHRKYAEKHELEYNVNLLKVFGIEADISTKNIPFDININKASMAKVNKTLTDSGVEFDKKTIIVHPGSGGSAIDLPIEKFSHLVNNLSLLNEVNIIITGNEDEKNICNIVSANTNAIDLSGKFTLSEIICLISLSDIFISNSTGPLHIAAAFSKFVVGFYPKIRACSPERWGPYTQKKVIFTPEIECNDCTREQCERLNCMNSIDIEKVTREVTKLIRI
jgi:lipopolysaccharide heptosyltransferase II